MPNLLERAINADDADRAAKIIQDALGIENDDVVQLLLSALRLTADRSRAARPYHRRMAEDRRALFGLVPAPAASRRRGL